MSYVQFCPFCGKKDTLICQGPVEDHQDSTAESELMTFECASGCRHSFDVLLSIKKEGLSIF